MTYWNWGWNWTAPSYNKFTFSVFTEAALLAAGSNNGHQLDCGDTFVVPGDCTASVEVCDNDNFLSGDGSWWSDDHATDHTGQSVKIDGHALQGQIYAESILKLRDGDGNVYTMVNLEVEGHDAPGAGNGYYAFYGDIPPAGTELTVFRENNCTGGIRYDRLSADCPASGGQCVVLGENLLENGGFEDNNLQNCGSSLGMNAGLAAWQDCGYKYAQVHEQDYGHGNATGNAIVELERGVVIAQQFNVDEDGTYRLCFDVTRRGHSDRDNSFKVLIDGQVVKTVTARQAETLQLDLDLDAGAHTLTFKSLSCSFIGAGLDNVAIKKVTEVSCDPEANDDVIQLCADDLGMANVLANDSDAQGDPITITAVDGQAISDGQTVTLSNGVKVTLQDGVLKIDGKDAYESLEIGETAEQTISYTISDGNGGEDTADLVATFCGAANNLEEIYCSLTSDVVKFQVVDENDPAGSSDEAFTLALSQTGDARLDGVYAEAYCLQIFDGYDQAGTAGTDVTDAPLIMGTLSGANVAGAAGIPLNTLGFNMETAADNLDMINWIMNQDFGAQGYTDAEIQGAIWALTDGKRIANIQNTDGDAAMLEDAFFIAEGGGDVADAVAIYEQAIANGEGFEAGEGDIVGIIVNPTDDQAPGFEQPFIIGIDYDDLTCLC